MYVSICFEFGTHTKLFDKFCLCEEEKRKKKDKKKEKEKKSDEQN